MSVAKVILDINAPGIWRTYDYLIPPSLESQLEIGATVVVPVRHSERLGYAIEIVDGPGEQLKEIIAVVSGTRLIGPRQIELSRWLAEFYLSSLSEALKLTMPPGARHRLRKTIELSGEAGDEPALIRLKEAGGSVLRSRLAEAFGEDRLKTLIKQGLLRPSFTLVEPSVKPRSVDFADLVSGCEPQAGLGGKQEAVLADLRRRSPQPLKELMRKHGASRATVNSLVERSLISVFSRREERLTETRFTEQPVREIVLNEDQANALSAIEAAMAAGVQRTILLDGVTGSGKTEVYLRATRTCLEAGRASIFIVPEIALLPQLVERLAQRFGDQVAVVHSGLPAGERLDAWQAAASGRKKVIVGARSALFAPVAELGLIVIDEEHETSFKQNSNPRYDARTVAAKLADIHRATLVLGSATPSLEAQWSAKTGGLHVKLEQRVSGFNLPSIKIVDMRAEMKAGNYGLFSDALIESLEKALGRGQNAILLINRRGFANFLLCRDCGYVPTCTYCAVSLTYHRTDNRLHCHHCGIATAAPELCPKCGNTDWRYTGAGTQRIESELNEALPETTVIRMDADTTAKHDSHRRQLLRFYRAKGAILLGTQMIAKGIDFPQVSLVGIINADTGLNLPDFRAAERTAQLLTQVSGRSGRGPIAGEVVIQTFNPESYAIRAVTSDYRCFCEEELEHRRELQYPPFSSMINIIFSSLSEEAAIAAAEATVEDLRKSLSDADTLLGPAPAPISKIKGYWRYHATIMTKDPERVKSVLRQETRLTQGRKNVKIIIDIDPVWLL